VSSVQQAEGASDRSDVRPIARTAPATSEDLSIPRWLYVLVACLVTVAGIGLIVTLRAKRDARELADRRQVQPASPSLAKPRKPTSEQSIRTNSVADSRNMPLSSPRHPAHPAPSSADVAAVPILENGLPAERVPLDRNRPRQAPSTLGLSYDQILIGLAGTFRMEAKTKADGTPMYEGKAERIGALYVIGEKRDVTETSLAILMPRDQASIKRNLAITEVYLRNTLPDWDPTTAMHWFQQSVATLTRQPDATLSRTVGRKSVWINALAVNEGLLTFLGVSPATPDELLTKTREEEALERALAHRPAVERRPQPTLGLTYAQVLVGVDDSFDMQPAPPANGLPGFYGSTTNQGLSIRISGPKQNVAAVNFSFVLGGEGKDGVANVVVMALVVLNVCPEWKGFVEWVNANKKDVLDTPRKDVTHLTSGKLVKLSGLRNLDLGAEMLFIEIVPVE
jgi:hypothetical protein